MSDILLLQKDSPILIDTPVGIFKVLVNSNNELQLHIPDKLSFKIYGNLNVSIDGELNIDSSELNVVTNGKDINLDSVNANIHLNSYRAKQIKNIPKFKDERLKQEKVLKDGLDSAEKDSKQKHLDKNHITELYDLLGDVLKRLAILEEKDRSTIELSKSGLNSYVMERFQKLKEELLQDD